MEMDKKKAITRPIVQTAVIMAVFYAFEIPMVWLDVFPEYSMLLTADIILRIALGTLSLVLLHKHSVRGESKYTVKQLFTNRIPAKTWLVLIPFIISILLPFLKLFTAFAFASEVLGLVCLVIFQQFAVGFYEETAQRALMMNGLIKLNTGTVKQRLFTVFITGAFFGLGHFPNILFGENPLLQCPSTMMWGMFIAAVYMLSDNLLLVILLHTLSDSTFRIVKGLFGYARDSFFCKSVDSIRTVIDLLILPLMAILICVLYDRLKNTEKTSVHDATEGQ